MKSKGRWLARIAGAAAAVGILSCGLDKPPVPDGESAIILTALDTSGFYVPEWQAVPGAAVEVRCATSEYRASFVADGEGRVIVGDLPMGKYYISATLTGDDGVLRLLGNDQEFFDTSEERNDTIFMSFPTSPLVINEIYYCGCNASGFYFYDQYVELYNSTADTIYLDGFIVCRSTQVENLVDLEAVDYSIAYYVYRFPGTRGATQQCPIAPKGYQVLATDAINHHNYGALCVDLTNADWEFFKADKNDYDNPAVPNLEPVTIEGNDFSINLGHTAIWVATGEGIEFVDHWNGNDMQQYMHVPNSTILDGVEYASSPNAPRYMSLRIDAGFGGLGMPKYSGRSIERRAPGLDADNSVFDFEITNRPTPGYAH